MNGTKTTEMLDWLREQLAKAEQAVRAREQAEECWRGGSDKSWRVAGCKLSKSERLRVSEREGRILVKCRRDVQMFKALIALVAAEKNNL